MTPLLYAHPFSSYCQKVLVALYETGTPFELRRIDDEAHMAELAARWPLRRFPILVDGGGTVLEASTIIEHLQLHHPSPVRLIPEDPAAALEVRMMDRVFDNYVSTPQQKCTFDAIRPAEARDAHGVAEARAMLETIYAWLDARLADRTWAAGETFSLADCGAAPFLFYAQWTHAIPERHAHLRAYRRRLMNRPSFARVLEEARPYRSFFPLGKIEDE